MKKKKIARLNWTFHGVMRAVLLKKSKVRLWKMVWRNKLIFLCCDCCVVIGEEKIFSLTRRLDNCEWMRVKVWVQM